VEAQFFPPYFCITAQAPGRSQQFSPELSAQNFALIRKAANPSLILQRFGEVNCNVVFMSLHLQSDITALKLV